MKIDLKKARLSDAPLIAKLHAENWRRFYRGIYSDNFLDFEVEKDRQKAWYDRLRNPAVLQEVIVAFESDQMIGFSCLFLNQDSEFGSLLDNLHIIETKQKLGIGKLLVTECARLIQEKCESKKMYLWVFERNQNARRAYERLGAICHEIISKENLDRSVARACRYVWNDIRILLG